MKKKLLSLALALAVCLSLLPGTARTEGGYMNSGGKDQPKLSKAEIAQLLKDNPTTGPSKLFAEEPSCAAPYAPGALKEEVLQATLNRLNALRRLAGLPPVSLDMGFCEDAQYGAVLSVANGGEIEHHQSRPSDMPEDFYRRGYDAISSSNLAHGSRSIPYTIDAWMRESNYSGFAIVGHRRWQLNPTLGKVGFGYARNKEDIENSVVVEKVMDTSGPGCDYDFISWPASGNFPWDMFKEFHDDTLWSVTVNPEKYAAPKRSDLYITVKRERDGATWNFSPSTDISDYAVDTVSAGVPNVISFPIPGDDVTDGIYTVEITGLKTANGAAASISYQVDFFEARTYTAPPAAITADPTSSRVLVNGVEKTFDAYNIGGANYFRLRDLAYVLSGTEKQFEVGWDNASKTIALTSGKGYTAVGGEMTAGAPGKQSAAPSSAKLLVDGKEVSLTAYNIGGANYFKLRDIGQTFDFGIGWDDATRTITIDTGTGYTS